MTFAQQSEQKFYFVEDFLEASLRSGICGSIFKPESFEGSSAFEAFMAPQDPRPVVGAMYAAWFARDIPRVLDVCDDIVRVSQYYSDPKLPFTGTTVGKAAYAARLSMIFGDWRFDRADHTFTYSDTVNARTRLTVSLRHLNSGQVFEGAFRHMFVVRNERITQIEEFVDLEGLRAFLRLIR